MPDSVKTKITADLEKAKEEGKLRSDRIREIVQAAVSQATLELKEGSTEIRSVVRDAVSTVIENIKGKGEEVKEEVTASIEGAIQGISSARRKTIAKNQAEIEHLQTRIDAEEKELQEEIDGLLTDIEETGKGKPPGIQASIESAINSLKDTEEVSLLQKRYAQLKTQLAILQANLATRYGERYEDARKHLDDAKTWYERAQPQAEVVADQVKQKRTEFENKLGEAGTALAQREKRVKHLLKELWETVIDKHDK
jgi:hypothetical protein